MDSVNYPTEPDGPSLLREVTRLYVRAQRDAVACCGPQSTARCHVLGELARSGPLRLTELALRLDADKSWTSRTVASMSAEGLVSCTGAEGDGRVLNVELTGAGRVRWEKMDGALRRHAEGALGGLSREDRQVVERGLALLRQVLEGGRGVRHPHRASSRRAARSRIQPRVGQARRGA